MYQWALNSSYQNSQQGSRSSASFSEKDIPGAMLCGHDHNDLHTLLATI